MRETSSAAVDVHRGLATPVLPLCHASDEVTCAAILNSCQRYRARACRRRCSASSAARCRRCRSSSSACQGCSSRPRSTQPASHMGHTCAADQCAAGVSGLAREGAQACLVQACQAHGLLHIGLGHNLCSRGRPSAAPLLPLTSAGAKPQSDQPSTRRKAFRRLTQQHPP